MSNKEANRISLGYYASPEALLLLKRLDAMRNMPDNGLHSDTIGFVNLTHRGFAYPMYRLHTHYFFCYDVKDRIIIFKIVPGSQSNIAI